MSTRPPSPRQPTLRQRRAPALLFAACTLVTSTTGWASPFEEPSARQAERICRIEGLACVLGASDHSRLRLAERLALLDPSREAPWLMETVALDLAGELTVARGGRSWTAPPWRVEPLALLGAGDLSPDYRGGDPEAGLLSVNVGGEGRVYPGFFELGLAAEGRLGLFDPSLALGLREAWVGGAGAGLVLGFGMRDRHLGPGRLGSLMFTDNASPPPLGTVAYTSPASFRFGRVHLEAGAGWIPGERSDVDHPGLLMMDLRYLPVPQVELGLSRVGIFGGEGRPMPPLGQLLLPTDPHVYDDPDRVEPDQDERAALDIRVSLPLGRWMGRSSSGSRVDGLDYVEAWWQYGGEDVIRAELGPIPYPSLAGIANLYGAEAAAGPLVVTAEGARILDDYFRWYTGHRVYNDGFTRDGRSMAHAAGGDSVSWGAAVAWEPGPWGAELRIDRTLRVGVVEALGDKLLALQADERRLRLGLRAWRWTRLGWGFAQVQVERIQDEDFVAGADGWAWRLAVGR